MSDITSYRSNPLLKRENVKIEFTEEEIEEYIKCSNDPIYFIKNHVKIVHVDRGVVPFDLYDYQENMINNFNDNRFNIVKCPRQIGKCLDINTPIRLKNKSTGDIIETTIGDFYDQQKANLL